MATLPDLLNNFPMWGNKPCIIYRTGVRRVAFSYEQLYAYVLRMSGRLASLGVGEGDRVLLWGPNGPWWAVAFWGCVARGAIVVPVDFMSGLERAETIAGLTDVRLVIQSMSKPERPAGRPVLFLEDLEYLPGDVEAMRETADSAPDDIAQIIYTSGTTGNPKGVILTHRNLLTNLHQVNEHIPVVGPEFVFLSLLPLSHMFEQMGGFLTPLYRGASVVYLRTLKPSAIMDALREEDIYALVAVPRLLKLLRNSIEREFAARGLGGTFRKMLALGERLPVTYRKCLFYPVQRKFGSHFTFFVSGGAALAPDDFHFWNAMGFTVLEGYGLTECSPVLAANSMERQEPGSVGKAVPGVALRTENNEILAKGDNIFPGYYQNALATQEAFSQDGWFRTGDLGELTAAGYLYIKGRAKELIVTGAGINVYPDEIEDVLNGISGVREACVLGLDRGAGEEVHAVLLLDGSGVKPDEIIRQANVRLDTLHRITCFSLWPEPDFPKTTTMKIRKFKVREHLLAGNEDIAAMSQDLLATLICRATGSPVREIREEALLMADLGLTSIGRLELVNSIEEEFRLDLEESAIDQRTRVADLRKMVTGREQIRVPSRFRFWTNRFFFRMVRKTFDAFVHYPLMRLFAPLEVSGLEVLSKVESPVIFISNHLSYLDYGAIMFSLPKKWRYHTATAAREEFFFQEFNSLLMRLWKRFTYEYGTMVLNLFPLPQKSGVRHSFRYMGRLADMGCNILIFPEGSRSIDGRLQPFREGLGYIVKELRIPVVPVHISGMEKVLPPGKAWPERGTVTVRFGEPCRFRAETPAEIVAKARKAVESLKKED